MEHPRTHLGVLSDMAGKEPDKLFELDEQVAELMASPVWSKIEEMLTEFRANAVFRVVHQGRGLDPADTANQLGFISGLEAVPEILRKTREVASAVREGLEADAAAEKAAKEYEEAPLWK